MGASFAADWRGLRNVQPCVLLPVCYHCWKRNLLEAAFVEDDDAVGELEGFVLVMDAEGVEAIGIKVCFLPDAARV